MTGKAVGLENLGNTCYANSALQILYRCDAFRDLCLSLAQSLTNDDKGDMRKRLFLALVDVMKDRSRGIRRFIRTLRSEHEIFRGSEQHDAHELLMFLINDTSENGTSVSESIENSQLATKLFEGTLIYETRCLCCEQRSNKFQPFLDLSVDIVKNSNIMDCILNGFATEMLTADEKYKCDICGCLQEGERKVKIGVLPELLIVHLKRFKYDSTVNSFRRIGFPVEFPLDLCLNDAKRQDFHYRLLGLVLHVGRSLICGHYIACVRGSTNNEWILYDDDAVTKMTAMMLLNFVSEDSRCAYILLYQSTILPPSQ